MKIIFSVTNKKGKNIKRLHLIPGDTKANRRSGHVGSWNKIIKIILMRVHQHDRYNVSRHGHLNAKSLETNYNC